MKRLLSHGSRQHPVAVVKAAPAEGAVMEATDYWHGDVAEVHMCQLAALENTADHPVFIKFTDDEAGALEERALQLALEMSVLDAEARQAMAPQIATLPAEPLARKEATRLMAELPAHVITPINRLGAWPAASNPEAKKKLRGLLPRFRLSSKKAPRADDGAAERDSHAVEGGQVAPTKLLSGEWQAPPLHPPPPRPDQDHPVSTDSNGQLADLEEHQLVRALAASQATASKAAKSGKALDDDERMAAALKESQRGVEVDKALADVKLLRRDMEGEAARLAGKVAVAEREAAATRSAPGTAHADAQATLKKVKQQHGAVKAVLADLASVEKFIKGNEVSGADTSNLAHDVVRRCLQHLSSIGFEVGVPPANEDKAPSAAVLTKFRKQHPEKFSVPAPDSPTSPSTPPLSPSHSTVLPPSPDKLHASPPVKARGRKVAEADTDAHADALLAALGGSSRTAAPSPVAVVTPPRPAEVRMVKQASTEGVTPQTPGVGETPVRTSRSRRAAAAAGSAASVPGPNGLQKLPQVDALLKELEASVPASELSANFAPPDAGQASTLSNVVTENDVLSFTPDKQEAAWQEAETHSRMLQRAAGEVREFAARSREATMPELLDVVRGITARLSVLESPHNVVLGHFADWPLAQWAAMKESVEEYRELTQLARQEQSWILQRGDFREESRRIETFYDTARARLAVLEARRAQCEARVAAEGMPFDSSVYQNVRTCSQALTHLLLSRVLVEVAAVERSGEADHERCLHHLASAARFAKKTQDFAGGLDADCVDLFDKVRRMTKYYLRVMAAE